MEWMCNPGTMNAGVNLKSVWDEGSALAAKILTRDDVFTKEEVDFAMIHNTEPAVTMYKPNGVFVGVTGST